jgi:hypothetical protein
LKKTPLPPRPCDQCRKDFTPARSNGRFCSFDCSKKWFAADYKKRSQSARPPEAPRPLPWATPEVCAAVRVGMDAPSAQKAGRFVVVRDVDTKRSLLVHVPTERLAFPKEYIVLFATLNERRRWLLQPAAREARP